MTYKVTISWHGYIGCDEEYEVEADSREEAERLALEEAMYDLTAEEIEEVDE